MRNVTMISMEQQQVNAMGCIDPGYHTLNLDMLAESSVRFTGAISTYAQCSASRVTWMAGKFPHQAGVYQIGHVLDPQDWGITKEFNRAGYETNYFGWHLELSPADHEFQVTDYLRRVGSGRSESGSAVPQLQRCGNNGESVKYLEDYYGSKLF
ncbi:sulfatase-like hydrolase/transferase [Paenibacillus sp. tmac-D7]|uniref:sulfatase-like hydrolase/transferase n=1 Tax=Paenibacillus sp. tmac-D7 TaxID=2591462 RepID=UPI0011439E39|nr:sulfatase-like hydrolase/transferase [Paenibacillus sp. tmac-D7]